MARLLKLGIYSRDYLAAFYAVRPTLADQPYAGQLNSLIEDRAASSDFWTRALARRGYDTCDVIANAEPLQRRWARENGVSFDSPSFVFDISAAQIIAFRPDILLVADYATFTPAYLREIRRQCPSIRLIVGWCGAPYDDLSVMREWDLALSCIPEMVESFAAQGVLAEHVDHAFDARVIDQLAPPSGTVVPFSFVGSVMTGARFHRERQDIVLELLRSTPLQLWSAVMTPVPRPRLTGRFGRAARRVPGVRRIADRLPPRVDTTGMTHPAIAGRAHPPVFGLEMFQLLRDSAVTLNSHIDVSPRSASNMRLFEATGVGTCLLTDWKANIGDLFEPDSEVVTYSSASEAASKYRYLADNPRERAAIAAAGRQRTLQRHNFDRRAERIDGILRKALHGRRAG